MVDPQHDGQPSPPLLYWRVVVGTGEWSVFAWMSRSPRSAGGGNWLYGWLLALSVGHRLLCSPNLPWLLVSLPPARWVLLPVPRLRPLVDRARQHTSSSKNTICKLCTVRSDRRLSWTGHENRREEDTALKVKLIGRRPFGSQDNLELPSPNVRLTKGLRFHFPEDADTNMSYIIG